MKRLILLMFLAMNVCAGIHYIDIEFHTGDKVKSAHIYQSDFDSQRYVKTLNLTNVDAKTIGTNRNYTIYLVTDYETSRKILKTDRISGYILHNFWYWILIILMIVSITFFIGYAYKRGKNG